jgi:hypothetical protein
MRYRRILPIRDAIFAAGCAVAAMRIEEQVPFASLRSDRGVIFSGIIALEKLH